MERVSAHTLCHSSCVSHFHVFQLVASSLPTLGWTALILPAIEVLVVYGMVVGIWLCFKLCRALLTTTPLLAPPNSLLKNAPGESSSSSTAAQSWSPPSPIAVMKRTFKSRPPLPPPPDRELVKRACLRERERASQSPPTSTEMLTDTTPSNEEGTYHSGPLQMPFLHSGRTMDY